MVPNSEKRHFPNGVFNEPFSGFHFNYTTTEIVIEKKILGIIIGSELNLIYKIYAKRLTKNSVHSQENKK